MHVLRAADVADLIGVPWTADGRDPKDGLSCYGLLLEVYRRADLTAPALWVPAADGSEQPRFAADVLAAFADHWEPVPGPAPMACLNLPSPWCEDGGHCAVLLGDDRVIHSMPGTGVVCHPLARIAGKVRGYYRLRALKGKPFTDAPCGYDPAVHDRVVPDAPARFGGWPREMA